MSDLKQLKCPFCGSNKISAGEVLTTYGAGQTAAQSMCDDCGALGPEARLPEGDADYGDVRAVEAWNRRTQPEAAKAMWTYDMSPPPGFVEYVSQNYKGDVIFHNPEWHAQRLWNAAMRNAKPPFVQVGATAPAQDLSAAILEKLVRYEPVAVQNNGYEWGVEMVSDKANEGRFVEFDDVRSLLERTSPANALSAGDRVNAMPPDVIAWVEAETARIAAVHEYNAAIEAAKRFGWPGPDTNPQYQKMNAAGNVAHGLRHAAYEALFAILQSQKGDSNDHG